MTQEDALRLVLRDAFLDNGYYVIRPATLNAVRKALGLEPLPMPPRRAFQAETRNQAVLK